jgi:hypothetical protein
MQGRRNQRKIYRRNRQRKSHSVVNEDTLNRINNLPPQVITENPLINQFFNGSSFLPQQTTTSLTDQFFNGSPFY